MVDIPIDHENPFEMVPFHGVVSGQSKLIDGAPVAVQTGVTEKNPKP